MCSKVACRECGKPSWAGCGQHIESALRGVAIADRCPGWQTGRHVNVESAYVPPSKEEPAKAK